MRGKGCLSVRTMKSLRITPAYAGKSSGQKSGKAADTDHPRLCGEKCEFVINLSHTRGSPPPMRGKEGDDYAGIAKARITPAYAGKSFHGFLRRSSCKDHPRLCGEKQCSLSEKVSTEGSPPPMRGKAIDTLSGKLVIRITPAYAGKRRSCSTRQSLKKDHPRLCGEKTKKIPKQRYFFHQPASFSFSLQYT